jgi:antitoxin component HigA of HigAB toxin-antitoxin module
MYYLIVTEFSWEEVNQDTYSWCIYKVEDFFNDLEHLIEVLEEDVVQVFVSDDSALEFSSYEDDIMPYMRIIEIDEVQKTFLTNSLGKERGLCSFSDIVTSSIKIT